MRRSPMFSQTCARARIPGDEALPTCTHGNHPTSHCNPLSTQGLIRDGCWTQNGYLAENRRMAAGFAAGVTEALVVVTPFEVVKIRLQQQKGLTKELLKYKVRSVAPSSAASLPLENQSRFWKRDHHSSKVEATGRYAVDGSSIFCCQFYRRVKIVKLG